MAEKPILFKGEMVRAADEGRKTQTRRVINFDHVGNKCGASQSCYGFDGYDTFQDSGIIRIPWTKRRIEQIIKPKYQVGDLLYVRESAKVLGWLPTSREIELEYLADGKIWSGVLPDRLVWKPQYGHSVPNGIFKEAARIWLEVTGVRVERVQDISEADAIAEGIEERNCNSGVGGHMHHSSIYAAFTDKPGGFHTAREAFECLWDSINSKRGFGWDVNPWVFVYEF